LKTKRGPLPTWGWIAVAVAGLLALRWYRNRASESSSSGVAVGPPNGLQPLQGAGLGFGTPLMSSSTVTPPSANGLGSSTVGAAAFHISTAAPAAAPSTGFASQSDFERGNVPAGYSGEQILAAAKKYAAGRSYQGAAYSPHSIQQEGQITYHGSTPGVMIKYGTGSSSSTEWTPI
jgi:hypothetical protein